MRLEKTAKGEGKTRNVVVNTVLVSWEGWALGGWKVPHHDAQGVNKQPCCGPGCTLGSQARIAWAARVALCTTALHARETYRKPLSKQGVHASSHQYVHLKCIPAGTMTFEERSEALHLALDRPCSSDEQHPAEEGDDGARKYPKRQLVPAKTSSDGPCGGCGQRLQTTPHQGSTRHNTVSRPSWSNA